MFFNKNLFESTTPYKKYCLVYKDFKVRYCLCYYLSISAAIQYKEGILPFKILQSIKENKKKRMLFM